MDPAKCPKNVPPESPPDRSCEAFGVARWLTRIRQRASEGHPVPPVWMKILA